MAERVIKLPDVGEGIAEAEIVEVHVKVGDTVREDQALAAVMTDKATVEIPSPVMGKVLWVGIEVGKTVAIGSQIFKLEVDAVEAAREETTHVPASASESAAVQPIHVERTDPSEPAVSAAALLVAQSVARPAAPVIPARATEYRPLASPAVRDRARELGINLRFVRGSGPAGRIRYEDLDAFVTLGPRRTPVVNDKIEQVKLLGLRRKIAERMQDTKRRIPHFSYIEEVDVTDLEALRTDLNAEKRAGRPKLNVLPFMMRALVVALAEFPQMNAHFEDAAEVVHRYGGVHIGIATQTPNGLMVPVVRHVEVLSIWDCARVVGRLAEAARAGTIKREELSGSTITITSLGALGGLATTPVINSPEVSIVGINKISVRPVWRGSTFEPRKIMNLSSSFDHRVIDGWDAAQFIQRVRSLLEVPAKMFMEVC